MFVERTDHLRSQVYDVLRREVSTGQKMAAEIIESVLRILPLLGVVVSLRKQEGIVLSEYWTKNCSRNY